jgi:hypothetical protein
MRLCKIFTGCINAAFNHDQLVKDRRRAHRGHFTKMRKCTDLFHQSAKISQIVELPLWRDYRGPNSQFSPFR